jgi:CDP-4-dehydro-6-deoxyglucose reductase
MPDRRYTKPWHGVARESIKWHPTVLADACIGCGTCVTGCSRLVYRYDFDQKKAVVADPLNCMVGCTTCANTCPTHAIQFPSLSTVFALESRPEVRHAIEDDLVGRREELAWQGAVPHPDRSVSLRVASIDHQARDVIILTLQPRSPADALCQFMPGQYLELLPPVEGWLSRAYSIGNAPRDDGSVELQVGRVANGRMSDWIFERLADGDVVRARGPRGHFTMRSLPSTPLVFVAGGTGFAPIKAMIEQEMAFGSRRDIMLFWGVGSRDDVYELADLDAWTQRNHRLRCILAIEHGPLPELLPGGVEILSGNLGRVISTVGLKLTSRDAYVAGPPAMMPAVIETLRRQGVADERVFVDSFGV